MIQPAYSRFEPDSAFGCVTRSNWAFGHADAFIAGVSAVFGLDSEARPTLRIVADEGQAS